MLQRPLLTPIVVGFWLVTSGWLVIAKILPTLNPGSPPGQQALYAAGNRPIPVAWTVFLNERPVGWALATSTRATEGSLVVDTRLHVENLPLEEMLPAWVSQLVHRATPTGTTVAFDARGKLAIDSFGKLRSFSSRVNLPGTIEEVVLTGTVDDGKVVVIIEAGGMQYEASRHLPSHVMIGDELSPQATLPGLFEGRCWTVPIYSPLRPGHAPIEILHAEVGSEATLYWENALVRVHVVSYREDPTSDREPRCRMWVDFSGRVLKQEAAIVGARMLFVRRTDEAAALLAEEANPPPHLPTDGTLTMESGAP